MGHIDRSPSRLIASLVVVFLLAVSVGGASHDHSHHEHRHLPGHDPGHEHEQEEREHAPCVFCTIGEAPTLVPVGVGQAPPTPQLVSFRAFALDPSELGSTPSLGILGPRGPPVLAF